MSDDNSILPTISIANHDELAGVMNEIMRAWEHPGVRCGVCKSSPCKCGYGPVYSEEKAVSVNACPSCGNAYNECACRVESTIRAEITARNGRAAFLAESARAHEAFKKCPDCDHRVEFGVCVGCNVNPCKCPELGFYVSSGKAFDPINSPAHYNRGGIEVIDAIEAWGLDAYFRLANVVKYIARHEHKGDPLSDLKKARWYLDREISKREGAAS